MHSLQNARRSANCKILGELADKASKPHNGIPELVAFLEASLLFGIAAFVVAAMGGR
jgi:hypothetical protein